MKVKCQVCGKKDKDRVKMVKDLKGYYHPSCHEDYQAQQSLKKPVDRITTCKKCKLKDTKMSAMEKTVDGYYHKGKCYEEYVEEKEFKVRESEQLDELVKEIARIHSIDYRLIPTEIYSTVIMPFRNDGVINNRLQKRYKEGFDYETIIETYLYCETKIATAISKKAQSGGFKSLAAEMKYAFAIVKNNVENMLRAKKRTARQKMTTEKTIIDAKKMSEISIKLKERKQTAKANQTTQQIEQDKFNLNDWFDDEED